MRGRLTDAQRRLLQGARDYHTRYGNWPTVSALGLLVAPKKWSATLTRLELPRLFSDGWMRFTRVEKSTRVEVIR